MNKGGCPSQVSRISDERPVAKGEVLVMRLAKVAGL